ncbi:UbiA family prenyltransferase [Skermanella aerolata]|uniref:UbiA family prenyltransferase n=1 Tax=Skermanella aerolata TaxID=393310 RepID=UPI003D1EA46B
MIELKNLPDVKEFPSKSERVHESDLLVPICVDLDGTLIRTDLLFESFLQLVRQGFFYLFLIPIWLLKGKAHLKAEIARHVVLDMNRMPVNEPLVDYLRQRREHGHRLYLFTAADGRLARQIAQRFDFFEAVYASDGITNLSGARKLASIRKHVGGDFIYAGDTEVDLPIWREARGAIVAGSRELAGKAARLTTVEASFPRGGHSPRVWARALRVHQWSKNLLVFVPFFLAGPLADFAEFPNVLLGALLLSILASGTYVVNDLLDIQADRQHRSKRLRPFASGRLPIKSGLAAIPACGLAVALLGALLPASFLAVAVCYLGVSLAYSFVLKRIAILDVIVLGGLFTSRILAGSLLLAQPPSYWLLIFSFAFFFSLALVKRYSELHVVACEAGSGGKARGYLVSDMPMTLVLGISSSIAALVILVLFLVDSHFSRLVYSNPVWLWPVCVAIFYWIMRVWLLTTRGEMHDDPIVFALKDRTSLALGLLVGASLAMAW